jgi:cell division protein ZapA
MSAKSDVDVLIGGKIYKLSGYESEEYLQRVASYINNKMAEMNQMKSYGRMSPDMQKTMLALNMADDYFKSQKRISELEADMADRDKAEYELKHELINVQMQLDASEHEVEKLKQELQETQKQVMRLEAAQAVRS